jgi:nucleotide-binding universal stress UspA family protein
VNDGTGRVPRLVVGISRSPASWWALAWAVGEARRRGARLLLVHVFRPPVAVPAAVAIPGMPPTSRDLYAGRVAYGNALIRTAIDQAVGWMPGDVAMEQQAFSGRPAVELASIARGGDLLVLGSRRRGWLRRLAPGSVARACARRADCPVVIVPEPSPSVLQVSLSGGSARVPRFRWVPRRGARTAS